MSAIITKANSRHHDTSQKPPTPDQERARTSGEQIQSREQFYSDYREAVRALRRGNPEQFLAYQRDHRINPPSETLSMPARPASEIAPVERLSPEQAVEEARFSILSLMSSVRGMVTVLGRVLS